ncbi:MAG: phosphomannose isomerase type II C-terminal cupin domain [Alcanivorax sp.]|nr:phosphomannose isomerase type II C-terminal cupin domain [Alcanivorax sp.]
MHPDTPHPVTQRPWGHFIVLRDAHSVWVKKLFIKANARLSLQSHKQRTEVWIVLQGEIQVQVGERYRHAKPDDVILVPHHRRHRIRGITSACVLEVAYGHVFEGDITRYDDDYGRQ